jgi:hypothetical protein
MPTGWELVTITARNIAYLKRTVAESTTAQPARSPLTGAVRPLPDLTCRRPYQSG